MINSTYSTKVILTIMNAQTNQWLLCKLNHWLLFASEESRPKVWFFNSSIIISTTNFSIILQFSCGLTSLLQSSLGTFTPLEFYSLLLFEYLVWRNKYRMHVVVFIFFAEIVVSTRHYFKSFQIRWVCISCKSPGFW